MKKRYEMKWTDGLHIHRTVVKARSSLQARHKLKTSKKGVKYIYKKKKIKLSR